MLAARQIIEDPQEVMPIPPEFRHRRTEVIFIALDPIRRFRGKGRGGSVAALLKDREIDEFSSLTSAEV